MTMLISSFNLYARDADAPDVDLLEFLGEGVSVDNHVVDPMTWHDMEDMTGSYQDKTASRQQTKHQKQQDSRRQEHE